MKFNFICLFLLFLLFTFACISLYVVPDKVSCNVSSAEEDTVNGFYAATGGIYIQRGYRSYFFPDIAALVSMHRVWRKEMIVFTDGDWKIISGRTKSLSYNTIYTNDQSSGLSINNPPPFDWKYRQSSSNNPGVPSSLHVERCINSLQNSPPLPSYSVGKESNLQRLFNRPVVLFISLVLSYIFYLLYTNKIDHSLVTMSYDLIVSQKQYYRIVSSSLSHFELMHFGFNTYALYQFGDLEIEYGSFEYLYLSMDLIVITILIALALQHILITRFNRLDMIYQQGLGYSCVLFAWMVVVSVRMEKFCPVFLFPTFCLKTYHIPIPFTGSFPGLPVNFGPFVLLFVTKLILPQSSFLGHLSGIIIGYPLAWNMLAWLTPLVALSFCLIAMVVVHKYFVWTFPGYGNTEVNLTEFVPAKQLLYWKLFSRIALTMSLIVMPFMTAFFGPWQLLYRLTLGFLSWSCVHGRRCLWLTDQRSTHSDTASIMLMTLLLVFSLAIMDWWTLAGLVGAQNLIIANVQGFNTASSHLFSFACLVIAVAVFGEIIMGVLLILSLHDIPQASSILAILRADKIAFDSDMQLLGCQAIFRRCKEMIFGRMQQQPGHRLQVAQDSQEDEESATSPSLSNTSGSLFGSLTSRTSSNIPYQELATTDNALSTHEPAFFAQSQHVVEPKAIILGGAANTSQSANNTHTISARPIENQVTRNNGGSFSGISGLNSNHSSSSYHSQASISTKATNNSASATSSVYTNRSKNPSSLLK